MKILLFPILVMALLSTMAFASAQTNGISVSFVSSFGNVGVGDGRLTAPQGIALDQSGNIYVANVEGQNVEKFDSTGHFISKIETSVNNQHSYPTNVAVDNSGNIYVLDLHYGIEKFNSTGNFVSTFGTYGMGDAQIKEPQGIAIDSSGNIYITDFSVIQKYNSTGNFVSKFGSWGMKDGQINSTGDMAIDSSGNIFVSDQNERVEKFSNDGTFITKWGSYCSVNNKATSGVYCHDPDGSGPLALGDGQFATLQGIALDKFGNVFTTDEGNSRVQVFDPSGSLLYKFGSFGIGNAQFNYPNGIAVDNSGDMYVVDQNNGRVQIFHINYNDPTGALSNIVTPPPTSPTPPPASSPSPTCVLPEVLSSDGITCFTPPPPPSSTPRPVQTVTQTTTPQTIQQTTPQTMPPITHTSTPSNVPQVTSQVTQPTITVPTLASMPSTIPTWVKGIFNYYSQGQMSDDELINAINFLVQQGIVKSK